MRDIPTRHVVSGVARRRLLASMASGHTPLDEHWKYYREVMTGTGRSRETIRGVGSALRFFMLNTPLRSVESWMRGAPTQQEMLRLKRDRRWSAVTYNSYRKSLLSYFQVLADGGLIDTNPARRIRKCAEPVRDQPRLGKDQVAPLFECLGRRPAGMPHLLFRRNRLFFLLAYYTGARPVELLSLTLSSFSEGFSVLTVVGAKGSGMGIFAAMEPFRFRRKGATGLSP